MNGNFETKSIVAEVKDIDFKSRVITGYLSNFGNKDYDNDIIEKGAFKKSISERKDQIYFLNQHQWSQPHGKFNVLTEDSKGLYFESTPLVEGVSYSDDVLKLYEAGIVKEHSIGFNVVKSDYNRKDGVRMIKEIKLYEGSNVTMGANPETPFTGFKTMTLSDVKNERKKILKAFRNGTFTDDTFGMLEIALIELEKQAFELGKLDYKNSLEVIEPLEVTPNLKQEPNNADLIKAINNFKF